MKKIEDKIKISIESIGGDFSINEPIFHNPYLMNEKETYEYECWKDDEIDILCLYCKEKCLCKLIYGKHVYYCPEFEIYTSYEGHEICLIRKSKDEAVLVSFNGMFVLEPFTPLKESCV